MELMLMKMLTGNKELIIGLNQNERKKMDKSYVTLAICPICKEETGTLLLDKRLRPKFERHTVTPEPCEKCGKKYLSKGVLIFNPETGSLVVLKDSAFKRIMNIPIPKKKICFAHEDVLERLQGREVNIK
jgi:hypothetical protein